MTLMIAIHYFSNEAIVLVRESLGAFHDCCMVINFVHSTGEHVCCSYGNRLAIWPSLLLLCD